jgi:predicted secreted protein
MVEQGIVRNIGFGGDGGGVMVAVGGKFRGSGTATAEYNDGTAVRPGVDLTGLSRSVVAKLNLHDATRNIGTT